MMDGLRRIAILTMLAVLVGCATEANEWPPEPDMDRYAQCDGLMPYAQRLCIDRVEGRDPGGLYVNGVNIYAECTGFNPAVMAGCTRKIDRKMNAAISQGLIEYEDALEYRVQKLERAIERMQTGW